MIVAIPFLTTACDETPSGPDSWPEVSGPDLRVNPQYKTWATDLWRPINGVDAPVAVYWIDDDTVLLPGYRKGFREEDNPFALFTWRLGNEPVELARALPAKSPESDDPEKGGRPFYWDGTEFCAGMGKIKYGLEVGKGDARSFMIGPLGHLQKRSFVKEVRDFLASKTGENWGRTVSPFDCDLVFRKGMSGRYWIPFPDGNGYIDVGPVGVESEKITIIRDEKEISYNNKLGSLIFTLGAFKYYKNNSLIVISSHARGGRFLKDLDGCVGFYYLNSLTNLSLECLPDGPWRVGGSASVTWNGFLIASDDPSLDEDASTLFAVEQVTGQSEKIGIGHIFGVWTSPSGCRAIVAGLCKNNGKCVEVNNSIAYHAIDICQVKGAADG